MKAWKIGICSLVMAAGLVVAATAHSHPGEETPAPARSTWAAEEVRRAAELGLDRANYGLPEDLREPISRAKFVELALQFMAVQERNDHLFNMTLEFLVEEDPHGTPLFHKTIKPAFRDYPWGTPAYALGLIQGRGDGTFDPEGLITREEAAVMLARAYEAIGGRLPESPEGAVFTDQADIADWAQKSVAALSGWGIMKGMEDGSFNPRGTYSVEQCLLTFLRLYEKAPVSRINGNVTHHFTYEQSLVCLLGESGTYMTVAQRIEGPVATVIRASSTNAPRTMDFAYVIYRDGGIVSLDLGICAQGFQPSPPVMENPAFSEDGKLFTCTVTFTEDQYYGWVNPPRLLHPKGIYHIHVDVETLAYHYEYEPLPTA